jgi:hypothetical protein
VTFESAGPFTRDDNVPGFGRGTPFTAKAFELDRGKVSDPIQVSRGWVVMRVAGIEEARLPELAEVEAKVRDTVAIEKAKETALAALRQDVDRIKSGAATLDSVAKDRGGEVKSSGSFNRTAPIGELGREPAVAEAVFTLDQGAVGGPIATKDRRRDLPGRRAHQGQRHRAREPQGRAARAGHQPAPRQPAALDHRAAPQRARGPLQPADPRAVRRAAADAGQRVGRA